MQRGDGDSQAGLSVPRGIGMLAGRSATELVEPLKKGQGTATFESGRAAKRLIVNADDLGLSHGITEAIFDCHRNGIVTSASLMVNQAASEYAVCSLKTAPNLDVGIHLNLCQGKPVLPPRMVHSLVGSDGNFLPPAEMGKRLISWRVSPKEIEAEFCAQIDRMMSHGLTPSHADSHHRFHIYPAAAAAFRNAIRSRGIYRARSAKKQVWPANGIWGAHAGAAYRRLAVGAYNHLLQLTVFQGLKSPDAGVALHPKFRGNLAALADAWRFAMDNMPAGTFEIWCHPGFPQKGFSESDALFEQRRVEAAMLTDERLCKAVSHAGIELIDFQTL
jgi:predicted glycoside hydrolase/deacetylase ChbG (UPF0249 family)